MGKQPKPGQSNQLVLSAILAPLVSLVVIRQITPFSMSKFQAAKVSETGTLYPSCNDVLPVSCNIPRRNCSHHSETYMFLLNYMDNQLFFSSTASHWENHDLIAKLESYLPSALSPWPWAGPLISQGHGGDNPELSFWQQTLLSGREILRNVSCCYQANWVMWSKDHCIFSYFKFRENITANFQTHFKNIFPFWLHKI